MIFWIVALLLTLISVVVISGAFRSANADQDQDVAVYRDQLAEVDKDEARGVLDPTEAEAARTEVARRLLAADKAAARRDMLGMGNGYLGAGLVLVLVLGIAAWTYFRLGAPGYADLPLADRIETIEAARAARPGQAVAESEIPDDIDDSRPDVTAMAAQLRTVLQDRPDDLRGWELAAQTESGLNNMEAAWRAQDRVIAIKGADNATAADFALLSELMILAAGGYVSPEAEQALQQTLRLEPGNGSARYYAGLMYVQGGRPDLAWTIWRRLVADSTPDAPWLPAIYAQIEQVSAAAGDPTPLDQLPSPRGPSADDIQAAGDMTLEERMGMIEGMVSGLAERLATEGGPARDWARLITAYGVLGQTDAAAAVYAEAKVVFGADQGALDTLAAAADRAGVAQ